VAARTWCAVCTRCSSVGSVVPSPQPLRCNQPALVRAALEEGRPHAMAVIDMRMPPGWDALQTIEAIWKAAPDLEVVIAFRVHDRSRRRDW
jgi:hypothetical protein